MHQYGVQIIFHAAAYKHVPMMEANLPEALKNNVFALLSLLDVAQESECEGFVLISSDKAVTVANPVDTKPCMPIALPAFSGTLR